jgi:hypothetical protein
MQTQAALLFGIVALGFMAIFFVWAAMAVAILDFDGVYIFAHKQGFTLALLALLVPLTASWRGLAHCLAGGTRRTKKPPKGPLDDPRGCTTKNHGGYGLRRNPSPRSSSGSAKLSWDREHHAKPHSHIHKCLPPARCATGLALQGTR